MKRGFDELMRGYLDGDLDERERRALAEILRGNADARDEAEALEALHVLLEELGDSVPEPSADLDRRVMEEIAARTPPKLAWWRRLVDACTMSPYRLAMSSGVLLAVGLLVGLGVGKLDMTGAREPFPSEGSSSELETAIGNEGVAKSTPQDATRLDDGLVRVHFVLRATEAGRVSVVGGFNGWDPRLNRLERVGDVWRAIVPLPRGRHEYQFVVDGEIWIVDPAAQGTVDDGFGGQNGVLEV